VVKRGWTLASSQRLADRSAERGRLAPRGVPLACADSARRGSTTSMATMARDMAGIAMISKLRFVVKRGVAPGEG
jgi:hypothetical protein